MLVSIETTVIYNFQVLWVNMCNIHVQRHWAIASLENFQFAYKTSRPCAYTPWDKDKINNNDLRDGL